MVAFTPKYGGISSGKCDVQSRAEPPTSTCVFFLDLCTGIKQEIFYSVDVLHIIVIS